MSSLFSEVNNDEKNVISVDLGKQKRWELLQVFNAIFVMPAGEVFVIPVNHPGVVLRSGELFLKIDLLFLSLLNAMGVPFIGYAKNCAHTNFLSLS
jgi:hypothetical protein